MEKQWYVLYTKPLFETKISELLSRKKIENYFPIKKVVKNIGAQYKLIDEALLKNYVFVKTNETDARQLKKIPGIVNLVYWLGEPVIIQDTEIKLMKSFLADHVNVIVKKIIRGDKFVKDPDTSVFTVIDENSMTIKNKKINVFLPSLGYILTAEAEMSNIRIISSDNLLQSSKVLASKRFNPIISFNNFLKN